ncbi:OST-HTH/LOTUS domain-containing protein [Rhodococcus sp. IEGM1428]|uniref:OST-HTH/LOTUS domain-containing protein n=1 Tax=Rhodococcus sp. IEGM1428 TaxID=3392191 RepID=UPI003D09E8B6
MTEPLHELRDLITNAFDFAARQGRSGTTMTSAVLKNTLLTLTGRTFNESQYGFDSFIGLIRSLPDLVTVEGERPPFVIRLATPPFPSQSTSLIDQQVPVSTRLPLASLADTERIQVRQDLWRAALDYTAPYGYWWVNGEAVEASAEIAPVGATRFQPITRDELNTARLKFGEQYLSPEQTTHWINVARGAIKALPERRAEWAAELKRLVISHVETWFEKTPGLERPNNLFSTPQTGSKRQRLPVVARPPARTAEQDDLRQLVLSVVRAMTEEELGTLQLPASAVLRVHQR